MTRTVEPVERLRLERPNDIYLALRAPRYKLLLKSLGDLVSPSARVLDIGRSSLSTMIAQQFGVTVDTLGFAPDEQTDIGVATGNSTSTIASSPSAGAATSVTSI